VGQVQATDCPADIAQRVAAFIAVFGCIGGIATADAVQNDYYYPSQIVLTENFLASSLKSI
jgi:hypothetical protein